MSFGFTQRVCLRVILCLQRQYFSRCASDKSDVTLICRTVCMLDVKILHRQDFSDIFIKFKIVCVTFFFY